MKRYVCVFFAFLFYTTILYGADDFVNYPESEAQYLAMPEAVPISPQEVAQKIPTTAEIIGAFIIIPVKWLDSAVNQVFYMLIPIKGVSANIIEERKCWVGEGAKWSYDGRALTSKDGLRQYRPPDLKDKLGKVQANLESRLKPEGRWLSNGHLDILD
jgi:hypothetical protein